MPQILPFYNGFMSNWYPSKFVLDGVQYNCAEQAMMAKKAALFGDEDILQQIMETDSPRKQKSLGRKVKGFNDTIWKNNRYNIVYRVVEAKFAQNTDLLLQLISTGDKTICEASPYDRIWGVGLAENDSRVYTKSCWQGLNLLGEVLMEVREKLGRIPDDDE